MRIRQWNGSDKLAFALACAGMAMAIVLFWIDKTPLAAGISIAAIVLLLVYPVIHFLPSRRARIWGMIAMLALVGIFGWRIWPKPTSTTAITATKQQPPDSQQQPDSPATSGNHPPTTLPVQPKPSKPAKPQPLPSIKIDGDVKQGGNGDCQANSIGGNATIGDNCGKTDPMKDVVFWTADGTRVVRSLDGMHTSFSNPFGNVFGDESKMASENNWSGLLQWSEEKKKIAPGWYTPDVWAASAQFKLCCPKEAKLLFNTFMKETENVEGYERFREIAQQILTELDGTQYSATCSKPQ